MSYGSTDCGVEYTAINVKQRALDTIVVSEDRPGRPFNWWMRLLLALLGPIAQMVVFYTPLVEALGPWEGDFSLKVLAGAFWTATFVFGVAYLGGIDALSRTTRLLSALSSLALVVATFAVPFLMGNDWHTGYQEVADVASRISVYLTTWILIFYAIDAHRWWRMFPRWGWVEVRCHAMITITTLAIVWLVPDALNGTMSTIEEAIGALLLAAFISSILLVLRLRMKTTCARRT